MQTYLQYRRFSKQLAAASTQAPSKKLTISLPQAGIIARQCSLGAEEQPPPENRAAAPTQENWEILHGGEVERADLEVEIAGEISRINTQEVMGNSVSMTVTGVEMQTDAKPPLDKQFVVLFEGLDDKMNPHNWSVLQRLRCTLILSLVGAAIEYSTVVDSRVFEQAVEGFHTDEQRLFLVTGIFLIGIGVGSLFTGPFSEVLGRNLVYIVTLAVKMLFATGAGFTKTVFDGHTKLIVLRVIFRFFSGFFGSASLVCTSGAISDLWTRRERVYMYPVYGGLVFMAPMIAAFIDSIIVIYKRGKFVYWANVAIDGFVWSLVILFLPETYVPVLLQWKARHIRKITGDRRYRAPIELRRVGFASRLRHALWRPFLFLFRDRIIGIIAAYAALIYLTLFTIYIGLPFIFTQIYGFGPLFAAFSFFSCIGGVVLIIPAVYLNWRFWVKDSRDSQRECCPTKPEVNLHLAIIGAPAIPVASFWMGWTARSVVSPASPLVAVGLFSFGAICVIVSISQYVTDSFYCYVASALVAVMMPRYIAAGLMSLVAVPFYKSAGPGLTLTFAAILSVLMAPIPFVLYKYGDRIRSRSVFIRPL